MNHNDVYVLKDAVSLFRKQTSGPYVILSFLFHASRLVVSFKASGSVLDCIKLLDGDHSLQNISQKVRLPTRDIAHLVRYLVQNKIVVRKNNAAGMIDSRYVRQVNFFASFETSFTKRADYQRKIREAHAVIVGCGGIGSWVVEHLARCGMGKLTIIDPDVVDCTNLSRQAIYSEEDIGRKKVDVLKEHIQRINRDVKVHTVEENIKTPHSLLPLMKGVSVVLQCADHPDIEVVNDIVSRACFHFSIPHILCGGYDGHLSYLGQTVIPYKTSCWRCYVEGRVYERSLRGFEHVTVTKASVQGGTLSPIACITASIHALDAIRLITGFSKPLMLDSKAELDFLSFSMAKKRIPRKKDCSLCGEPTRRRIRG